MESIDPSDRDTPIWVDAMVSSDGELTQLRDFLSDLFDWSWDHGSPDMDNYSIAYHRDQPVLGLGQSAASSGRLITYFGTNDIISAA